MKLHHCLYQLCLYILFFVTSVQAGVVDRSVAIVNDDIITLSEVNELGKPLFQRIAEEAPTDQLADALQQARQNVIKKLVDQKLIAQQAKKLNISVSDDDVEQSLQRILQSNNASMAQFQQELIAMGISEARYRENLREQILSSRLVNYEVRSKIIIPEEMIIDYYDLHYTEQVDEGGYYILQIGSQWGQEDKKGTPVTQDDALKKIEKVRMLAVNGDNFKELAKKHSDLPSASDGGDLGVFQENEMAGYMKKAVTGLKPGDISTITETPVGYQFFKLLSSQEGQIITKLPYEQVKEEIRETLYQQELQLRLDTWLKDIREQAYIKIL